MSANTNSCAWVFQIPLIFFILMPFFCPFCGEDQAAYQHKTPQLLPKVWSGDTLVSRLRISGN